MILIFFAIWIILNGKVTLEIALFGVAISAVMFLFICKFMDYSVKKELKLYRKSWALLCYVFVLLIEILKANWGVVRLIYTSRYEIEPVMVTFKSPLKSKFLNVILANSITLTPGTITVSMEENVFTVHCLDKELAAGMDDSVFVHLLEKMEEKEAHNE
ncbi:MAG: Na+/H+ antiporter subunit E [Lachnospiraceae bacterium]|nr:Na+/H+ antiporter subunit E [Lachnospiraceae bacterium]